MSNIDYTLWPNANGNLGEIKVQIPDGINVTWPEGDALVGNFVYNKGELVGFVDTKALIANDSKSTSFPYDYVNIQVDKSLESVMTFNGCAKPEYLNITYTESGNTGNTVVLGTKYLGCKNVNEIKAIDPDYLTNDIVDGVWKEGLSDLTYGLSMFQGCSALTTFPADLSKLGVGNSMFAGCSNLTTFSSNLPSLTDGNGMFAGCSNLPSFSSDLSELATGNSMFQGCTSLTSWNINLPSLQQGASMFTDCTTLTSFTSDLSKLGMANGMFNGCTTLTSFTSKLHNLGNAIQMFNGCKLDTASVKNIADTIKSSNGMIHIGIGNTTPNTEEATAFNTIASKGWTVYVMGNGGSPSQWTPTSLIPIDGEEQQTPIPFWAKPAPSDEQNARYVDSEGNFYNILGAQFIYGDSLDTYGMFLNEEDAAANMSLTKIEK